VYPNPASNIIWIQALSPGETDRQIDLININGQRVLSTVLKNGNTSAKLDLNDVAPGLYVVKIADVTRLDVFKISVSR
jgi:hypothetical protein